ncbi:MAG: 1-acyl-sn-glycerol-3-phosphate acyltransferase [Chloroflexi bacterium]|nr:1-acyl-sn-glycerol-3-phosphate acyltransferase [Chloroflexota bacterium]
MPQQQYSIAYPRKRFVRTLLRSLVRIIFPMLFKITITGKENFPESGPLIVVGNHPAAVEVVLMAAYTPWNVEPLGAGDVPQEKITQVLEGLYGQIPIRRGHVNRVSLQKAVDVLTQKGIVGIFPEGGVWNSGEARAHSGVSWLSYKTNTPILPIGYGGTTGALTKALQFKRPKITMNIGKLIPPANVLHGKTRKAYFSEHSKKIMRTIYSLVPSNDPSLNSNVRNERFELEIKAFNKQYERQIIPQQFNISHPEVLANFFHQPMILYIFSRNLEIPTLSLEKLDTRPSTHEIAHALRSILAVLNGDYPYLLSYRVGPKTAELIKIGLNELEALALWAEDTGMILEIDPIRYYFAIDQDKEIIQIKQEFVESWM